MKKSLKRTTPVPVGMITFLFGIALLQLLAGLLPEILELAKSWMPLALIVSAISTVAKNRHDMAKAEPPPAPTPKPRRRPVSVRRRYRTYRKTKRNKVAPV
jgi:hypothetical protein